ncbi:IclR family transcriptional regulator [Nocardioides sp. LHD-245]|uniref:IclR family transcriptional regulator n=1 Tax=Nocardioides sp. LHD-245 TaxID=3051387 RepID=UPI0027E1F1CD|nr:IclR family transcriptional regulator [Nocardioides sp. LHD-245]
MANSENRAVPAADPPSILTKVFDLLHAFNTNNRVMTLSELARASGLPKSTVHRLIARLIDLGAVEPHRSGYVVSVEMLSLATNTPAGGMRDAALPFMAALHRWSGHSVQLAVLRQFDVVLLETITAPDSPGPPGTLGSRIPANCTALGKVLLSREHLDDLEAFLPRPMPMRTRFSVTEVDPLVIELRKARTSGIAYDREESQLNLASAAVPIVIRDYAVGALAVSHPADVEITAKVEQALRETAAQIARVCRDDLQRGKAHYFPHEF